jgi:4-amino-4-deoxy-L-arabinose transferase-like glycosyltransferase
MAAARGFDGLYGQDAYAYFDYSVGSVRQSLLHAAPLEPFFWPPGYPLLVALGSLAIGPTPLAGQLVSLLAGALVPILTALLVLELWPGDTPLALLAGALVALCGQLWQSSVVVMADTTGLALATFAAWALARHARGGRGAWLLAAGGAIGYATLARWIYGLVAIALSAYLVGASLVGGQRARGTGHWVFALTGVAIAALILVPVIGPAIVGLLSHPAEPAAFAGNFQVYSWSPLNAFRREFQTADGHLAYPLPNGIYYAIAPANLAFFGPLLAPWIVVGLYAARRWPKPILLLVAGWAAIVYAVHAGAPWQNFRFTLAYLPPLAILVATGLLSVYRYLTHAPRTILVIVAATGLVVSGAGAVRLEKTFIDRKDEELALVRWVTGLVPPGAQLLTFGPTLAFRHYTRLPTFDLFEVRDPAELNAVLSTPSPHYVLVDEASVEGQWLGQPPSTNFHLIRDGPGLTPLGTEQAYTLYRVGAP